MSDNSRVGLKPQENQYPNRKQKSKMELKSIQIDFAVMKIHSQKRCQRKGEHDNQQIDSKHQPSREKAIGIFPYENRLRHVL